MKLFALTLSALALASTAAQAARVGWEGRAVVTALNQTCIDAGETVGASVVSFFIPSDITPDNGPESSISFYGGRNAFALKVVGPFARGKNYRGVYINSYGRPVDLPNPAGQIVAYAFTAAPAPLSVTTEYVNTTITISNWNSTPGCTATLKGSYVRRR